MQLLRVCVLFTTANNSRPVPDALEHTFMLLLLVLLIVVIMSQLYAQLVLNIYLLQVSREAAAQSGQRC